jgi:hypothetical protein
MCYYNCDPVMDTHVPTCSEYQHSIPDDTLTL